MPGVGGDGSQGLGHRLEQDVEYDPAIAERDRRHLLRQGEDDVEVGHRQQVGGPRLRSIGWRPGPGRSGSAGCGRSCKADARARTRHRRTCGRRGRRVRHASMLAMTLSRPASMRPSRRSRKAPPARRKISATPARSRATAVQLRRTGKPERGVGRGPRTSCRWRARSRGSCRRFDARARRGSPRCCRRAQADGSRPNDAGCGSCGRGAMPTRSRAFLKARCRAAAEMCLSGEAP